MNENSPLPAPVSDVFGTSATNDNAPARHQDAKNKKFDHHYDTLLSEIWFATEEESIHPNNVEKTKAAFHKFFKNMGWVLAEKSFQELLKEKSGEFEFRADRKTPNWYHEFRECLWALNFIRQGLIHERDINAFGGPEVLICILLRHDSWEDHGIHPDKIANDLKTHIQQKSFSTARIKIYDNKIGSLKEGVDFLTKKIPVLDEKGNFVRKPNGKIVKQDRFDGDVLEYYHNLLKHPFSAFGKLMDGIEGMVTRVGVESFTVEDDIQYAGERRMLYGRQAFERDTIELYPYFKDSVQSADSMLGISLVMLETLNDFAPNSRIKSSNARPIGIEKYIEYGPKGFIGLPPGFHPIHIKMGRMIAKAEREKDGRVENIITRAYLPALLGAFPNLTIYNKFTLSSPIALPKGGVYVPNMT